MAAKCTATSKQSGVRCKRWATPGATVCVIHGSRAPQTARKARMRLVEAELMQAAAAQNIKPLDNPLEALAQFAGEVVAWKDLIAGKLERLMVNDEIRYSLPSGEQLRAEVQLFERALDRVTTTLGVVARLNIDERLAKITERQAERLDQLLGAVFIDLGLDEVQQREGRAHLARRIRGTG